MNGKQRINEMYAFVTVDTDGTEGVIAFPARDTMMPMVGADLDRVEALRPYAERLAATLPNPIEIIRFTVRESIDTIGRTL